MDDGNNAALSGSATEQQGWIAAVLVVGWLVLLPLLLVVYVSIRFGRTKVCLWFRFHMSHTNAKFRALYLPKEVRDVMAATLYDGRAAVAHADEDDTDKDAPDEEASDPLRPQFPPNLLG